MQGTLCRRALHRMTSRECPAACRISTSPMAFFLLLKNFVMDLLGLHVHQMQSTTPGGEFRNPAKVSRGLVYITHRSAGETVLAP